MYCAFCDGGFTGVGSELALMGQWYTAVLSAADVAGAIAVEVGDCVHGCASA